MGNKAATANTGDPRVLLSDADIELLQSSTEFNRQQILSWFENFQNDCPTGKLTKSKFVRCFRQLIPDGDPEKFSKYAFDVFDTNKSGDIDFREFLVAMSTLSQGSAMQRLALIFRIYDIDKNGRIELREMEKVIQAVLNLKGVPKEKQVGANSAKYKADRMFQMLRADKHTGISEAEFLDGFSQNTELLPALFSFSANDTAL